MMKPDIQNNQYCYRYPHPALTVDCVIFGFDGQCLKILLVERGLEPYKGMWALPGGFVRIDETVEQAAARELREETNLTEVYLDQFRVYSDPQRDPRERVVTVAFIALVRPEAYSVVAGDDAANALWFEEDMLPPMAFDHERIIRDAREHLSEVLRIKPVAFQLLSKLFSLSELQRVYEAIGRKSYDRRNFQRKVLQTGMLEELPVDSAPMCGSHPDASPVFSRPSAGRPLQRLFSFRKKPKSADKKEDKSSDRREEGSTRDIFDF